MHIVETKRLTLDKASLNDAGFFHKLMNSTTWLEFIGDRGIRSEHEAADYIQNGLIYSYDRYGFGLYKIELKENKVPIGICGFVKRDYLDHADIGFAMLPNYEGLGFMLEAALACMSFGYNSLGLNPILAVTTFENTRSKHLLQKIGLHEIGKIKPPLFENEFLLFSTA